MTNLNPHRNPRDRYNLPPEVSAALQQESDEDLARLSEVWDLAGNYYGEEPDDASFRALGVDIWKTLDAEIQQETLETASHPHLRLVKAPLRLVKPQAMRWIAAAACIALLVAVGLSMGNQAIHVKAPHGEQIAHILPDGSTLTLNSGAQISYTKSFGETARTVELTRGEVYFDVKKAPETFSVETFNGAVTVLGTKFNIRAWPTDRDAATAVAVASGTVRFEARDNPEEALILEAGESARLGSENEAPLALNTEDTENALSWRAGSFKFSNHALGTVIDELERRFDVRITVSPQELLNKPVGILIENPLGAEEIIRDICELDTCQYRTVPGGYEITQPATE